MIKRSLSHFIPARLIIAPLIAVVVLLSCGLTVFAEEKTQDMPQPATPTANVLKTELFPSDVQTVIEDGTRQIIKTYILTAEQSPAAIPRNSFERDGWLYTLTDITEKRNSGTDTKDHTETITIDTGSNNLNAIIKQLSPTLEYQSEDGYCGILTLDLASVKCDAAGYKNSSYTVSATREYPNLSANDLSLIPKTITDNGRTLELDGVTWEVQQYKNVDYEDIPASYRAVAKYTAKASKSVITGYVTTAEYSGEITKAITGDTVYTAYFGGDEINPTPLPTEPPAPTATPTATPKPLPTETPAPSSPAKEQKPASIAALIICLAAVITALAGAAAFFILRRNVKIYRDDFSVLVAKDRMNAKSPVIDLSPLDGERFGIVIDKFSAKTLNGADVELRHGSISLKHKIAYEGNAYRIVADFGAGTIQAIY